MSNFVVPNTFTAGTKAKAEEVNENFTAIKDDLDTKTGQIQTLQTNVDTKVLKAGDTMTGDLIISKTTPTLTLNGSSTTDTYGRIYIKSARFTASDTTAPSSNMYNGGFYIQDVNGKAISYVDCSHRTNNIFYTRFFTTRTINGSDTSATLNLGVDANGNTLFSFPMCTTKATTTSSASSSKVALVTQNYKSGTSWYRVWSDGWIEQGGKATLGTATTFLKSFVDTNYTLTCSSLCGGNENVYVATKTKTQIKFVASSYTNDTYWYACGY